MNRDVMLSLEGKVALVSGCGSSAPGWGNGKAIAVLLARRGARVAGIDVDGEALDETRRLIEEEGGSFDATVGDVTDPATVSRFVEECEGRAGHIDVLVNNVGRSVPGGPVELGPEAWRDQLDVNLTSAYLMCREVLPAMERQAGGSIVNVASAAGLRYIGKPQVAYAAAKAALMHFTRTTAVIYASRGIRLNSVVPGLIDTPLVRRLADLYAGGDLDGFRAIREAQVPMGRMGDAWDVAHAVLYLASDEAHYVTGTDLVVDGGLTAATP
jgi:NAD(P)-dependent dehydrogenase (short-subunit alcohol dehydrogenase family)